MIVFGLGCAMIGRLYGTLMILVNGEYYPGFNVGMLGIIGSFLFFFSANFGQVDSVVDDGSSKYIKARLIALAAPLSVPLNNQQCTQKEKALRQRMLRCLGAFSVCVW